jgi:PAS domain S-box-containing protein
VVVENVPLMIFLKEAKDLRFVVFNRAGEELLGYDRKSLLGRNNLDLFPPEQAAHFMAKDREVLDGESGMLDIPEEPILTARKGQRLLHTRKVCIRGADGVTKYLLGISEDITERKQAEAELRMLSSHQDTILAAIPDIIMEVDNNKVYTWANQAGIEFFGEDVIGKEASYYFEGEQETYRSVQPLFNGRGETIYIESWQRRKDGAKRLLAWWCRSLKDSNGNVVGALAAAQDITEHKKMEEEGRKLRDKAEMSSRLAAVGEMAAGIAHEINNPLTGVLGFSQLLAERQDLPEDVKEQLQIVAEGSDRVKDIVRRMLTFARQTKPVRTSVNIHELIDNTLEIRSYVLRTANIEVVKHLDPDLPWIVVDPGQMQQVFLNLIVNAEYSMKKAHQKGTLVITTEKMDGHILITFKDDGTGMSQDTKDKLFNPFFTTKDVGEGTGLGLGLSRSIILEHGGTIEVESQPGKGAMFVITLPVNSVDAVAVQKPKTDSHTSPENFRSAHILVVDDEETIRSLVSTLLTQSGHTVDATGDATEALARLDSAVYDLVLMDIRMPGMSGMELYGKITEKHPELADKFIFITGDTSDTTTRAFLEQNKLSYITKPFDRETLLKKVNVLSGSG